MKKVVNVGFLVITIASLFFASGSSIASAATYDVTVKSSRVQVLDILGRITSTTNYWRTIRYTRYCHLVDEKKTKYYSGLNAIVTTNYIYDYR